MIESPADSIAEDTKRLLLLNRNQLALGRHLHRAVAGGFHFDDAAGDVKLDD